MFESKASHDLGHGRVDGTHAVQTQGLAPG
jgi:hypothetical protein